MNRRFANPEHKEKPEVETGVEKEIVSGVEEEIVSGVVSQVLAEIVSKVVTEVENIHEADGYLYDELD